MAVKKPEATKTRPTGKNPDIGKEGCGDYFYLEVRPRTQYKFFRFHDVGEPGHIQRLAGQKDDGSWEDQGWIISKRDAHMEHHFLKADSKNAEEILEIYGPAHHVEADVFIGHPHKHAE
jgi:hypothetical protein